MKLTPLFRFSLVIRKVKYSSVVCRAPSVTRAFGTTSRMQQMMVHVSRPWKSSGKLDVSQLRNAVKLAIEATGEPNEAKSLDDVRTHLPDEVRKAIQLMELGGIGGLAGFIHKEMRSDVQFISEDNIFHSRVMLRSRMKSPTASAAAAPKTSLPPKPLFDASSPSATAGSHRPRTLIETLDRIVEYLPTSFVQAKVIEAKMPKVIQEMYADSNFIFFMKRFRHYVDIRTQHGHSELRLKQDFAHPRRGKGDELYTSLSDPTSRLGTVMRRPPRNSEANLIGFLAPRIPAEFTPLAVVLPEISDIVSRHPAFDPRLGVTGLLEKYPDYFQFKDGKIRSRPYRSAPFSLEDYDVDSSPEKELFSKLFKAVQEAAEGKNYAEDKNSATVSTGKLYALLSKEEKILIKNKYKSFPRFLRLHGKSIVVSNDLMKVHLFKPEYEACADTLMDIRLRENKLSPDDPVLKIPAVIADSVPVDWAVKELYDALPLTQCAELLDILSLVPSSVRQGLPCDTEKLQDLLSSFPEYFLLWKYPDDPSVVMIQRAKVETPSFSKEELLGLVLPLVPDKGLTFSALLRRVPLPLQRCFYHHGIRNTLKVLSEYIEVREDNTVVRVA